MNLLNKLQSQYEQLWKYILRPTRTPYSQQILGPSLFQIKGKEVQRKDFELTNKRGYTFACSLWLPVESQQYPCVVYLHGNSSNRIEGTEYLRRLLVNKMALCTFDFSGCGNAEGEYISLGYHEQQDLQEVITYLKQYPKINQIALWGRSMGAVTTLLYLNNHTDIKAAVIDSPFKSLKALVEDMAQKTSKIPKIVLNGALKIISGTIQQKANFNLYDLNPMKIVSNIRLPAFFIVGVEDQIIPIEHTKDIFEAYAGDVKIIKMVKGRHNDNRPVDCVREVIRFLLAQFKKGGQKNINPQSKISEKDTKSEAGQGVQMSHVEDCIKQQQFSWSNLFSAFGKSNPKRTKQSRLLPKNQQKEGQMVKKSQKSKSESVISKNQKQKQSPSIQICKKLQQDQLQDRMRNYTYCYL